LEGERVAFLPRHGRGHKLTPTELPFRANIYAMKLLGVEYILSVSAVGSLQEKYAPTDFCIPDQFFDRTRARAEESTFFGKESSDTLRSRIRFAMNSAIFWKNRAKRSKD
jgi:5'-methylthioadenosine phosphorylase